MSKKADWGDVLGTMGMTVAVGLYVAAPPFVDCWDCSRVGLSYL